MGEFEPTSADVGQEAENILDRSPINHMANIQYTETDNHSHSFSHLWAIQNRQLPASVGGSQSTQKYPMQIQTHRKAPASRWVQTHNSLAVRRQR